MASHSAREVVVLGAGFSRAVSGSMPVANALGEKAYALARRRWPELARGSSPVFSNEYPFETWLSLFAQDLPHLGEGDNRQNAASFARLRDAIADALEDAQREALEQEPPAWLYDMVSLLHYRRATVISFNYDTLVEAAVESTYLDRAGVLPYKESMSGLNPELNTDLRRIHSWDILRDQPPPPPGLSDHHPQPGETFRLIKLHGSLDWWQASPDPAGATLVRSPRQACFGSPVEISEIEKSQYLPGRERFLVPPLAVKSSYYSYPMMRQLWQDAFRALRSADRISLVGYSLPLTDIVTAGMLEASIRDRRELKIEIANLDTANVARRLRALGGPNVGDDRLAVFGGVDCIRDFTASMVRRVQGEVVEQVRQLVPPGDGSGALLVTAAVGTQIATNIIDTITDGGDGLLELVPNRSRPVAMQTQEGQPTVRDLVQRAQVCDRIVVRLGDQVTMPVVAFHAQNFTDPNAHHPLFLRVAGDLSGSSL